MEKRSKKRYYEVLFEDEFLQPEVIEDLLQSVHKDALPQLKEEVEILQKLLTIVDVPSRLVEKDDSVLDISIAGLDGSMNGDRFLGFYYVLISAVLISYKRYEDPNPSVHSKALVLSFPPDVVRAKRRSAIKRALLEAQVGVEFLRKSSNLPEFLFLDGPIVPSSRLLPLHSWSYGKHVMSDDEEYTEMCEAYLGKESEKKVGVLLDFYNEARERHVDLVGVIKTPNTWSFLTRSKDKLKKAGLSVEEVLRHGIRDQILAEIHGYRLMEENKDMIFYTKPTPMGERPIFSLMYGFKDGDSCRVLRREDVYTFYVKTHLDGPPIRIEVFREVAENEEKLKTLVKLLHSISVPYPRGIWPVIYVPAPILVAHEKCTVKNPTLGLIGEDLMNRSIRAFGEMGDLITRPTWARWLLFRSWEK